MYINVIGVKKIDYWFHIYLKSRLHTIKTLKKQKNTKTLCVTLAFRVKTSKTKKNKVVDA
jgi:hypothetical protein